MESQMSLPGLTANQSLRALETAESGMARRQLRGLTPAEPFCVKAQWHQGQNPVGTATYAEAKRAKDLAAARDDARARAARANPGLKEADGYNLVIQTVDANRADQRQDYLACKQAAKAANIYDVLPF